MKTSKKNFHKLVLIVCFLITMQSFSQAKNILLLGNSYTLTDYAVPANGQYTRVPHYLQSMITSNDKIDEVFCSSNPGSPLSSHITRTGNGTAATVSTVESSTLNQNYRIGAKIDNVLNSIFRNRAGNLIDKWDFVVMQDHSQALTEEDPASSNPPAYNQIGIKNYYVTLMNKVIAKSTSVRPKFYLYKTWPLLNTSGQNLINIKQKITSRLNALKADLNNVYNPISPAPAVQTSIAISSITDVVGLYLNNSGNDKPFGIPNDSKHPSLTGSYLIALCLYATIYGEVPDMDSKFRPADVTLKDAKTIVRLVRQIYTPTLSISEIDQYDSHFTIYPNPVIDDLTVKFKNINDLDKLLLYNVDGKLVKELKAEETTKINFSGFEKGVYFLKSSKHEQSIKVLKN
jgi:Secretion system C-terminal sorting domain